MEIKLLQLHSNIILLVIIKKVTLSLSFQSVIVVMLQVGIGSRPSAVNVFVSWQL